MTESKATRKIAFDCNLIRPGCVLLQAALGGESSLAQRFPTESWLLSPTPDLQVYEATDEQIEMLVEKVEERLQQKQGGDHV